MVISSEDLLHHAKRSDEKVVMIRSELEKRKERKNNCWSCKVWRRKCNKHAKIVKDNDDKDDEDEAHCELLQAGGKEDPPVWSNTSQEGAYDETSGLQVTKHSRQSNALHYTGLLVAPGGVHRDGGGLLEGQKKGQNIQNALDPDSPGACNEDEKSTQNQTN